MIPKPCNYDEIKMYENMLICKASMNRIEQFAGIICWI